MADAPQSMDTAPTDGTRFLAWFQKVKLDEDDIATNEVIGGAWFVVSFSGGSWDYPTDLEAAGAYFFDDWCWAEDPVLWRDLPPEPVAADYTRGVPEGGDRKPEAQPQAVDPQGETVVIGNVEPCPYAGYCTEEGLCANGCEIRQRINAARGVLASAPAGRKRLCRDCADFAQDGICPNDGKPCAASGVMEVDRG